ncbi:uncharacterized protein LOC112598283 [Melanaphis sacchari]|uniref:uncharacterized protein LOC112598283 n=1 Tax=Melanaphis sacchari TaxID=742174 RepID=UPI000DC146E1|nr:uncharacterized protein LOC112598283 [Melanaphis sacchari]
MYTSLLIHTHTHFFSALTMKPACVGGTDQSTVKTAESIERFSREFIKKIVIGRGAGSGNYAVSPIGVNLLLSFYALNAASDKTTIDELHRVLGWNVVGKSITSTRNDYNKLFVDQVLVYGNHVFVPNTGDINRSIEHPVNRLISKYNTKFELCCTLNAAAAYTVEYTMDVLRPLVVKTKMDNHRHILSNVSNVQYKLHSPFYKKNTRSMPFRTIDNRTVSADTMYQFSDMPVCVVDGSTHVRLDCKNDGLFLLITLSNNETSPVQQLRSAVESFQLNKIVKRLRMRKVQLFLPKCKILSTVDVRPVLNDMNVHGIFVKSNDPGNGAAAASNGFRETISEFVQMIYMSFDDNDDDDDGDDDTRSAVVMGFTDDDCHHRSATSKKSDAMNALDGFGKTIRRMMTITTGTAGDAVASHDEPLPILSVHVNRPFFVHVCTNVTGANVTLYFGCVRDPRIR